MQIFRNTKSLLQKDILLKRYFATAANPLHTQFLQNKHKNAVRFEQQNRLWTFEELQKHSSAFAYGLVEMGYKPGDKLLVWTSNKDTAEVVSAQIGASQAGVTLVVSNAKSQQELEADLKSSDATGLLYSPNVSLGNDLQFKDAVQDAIPELYNNGNVGSALKAAKFPKLRWVVQTGFYIQPGQYKFRETLVYASKNFNTLTLPKFDESIPLIVANNKQFSVKDLTAQTESLRNEHNIQDESVPFVLGDAREPTAFSLGIKIPCCTFKYDQIYLGALNSVLNGNYCVYTGSLEQNQADKIADLYQGKAVKI